MHVFVRVLFFSWQRFFLCSWTSSYSLSLSLVLDFSILLVYFCREKSEKLFKQYFYATQGIQVEMRCTCLRSEIRMSERTRKREHEKIKEIYVFNPVHFTLSSTVRICSIVWIFFESQLKWIGRWRNKMYTRRFCTCDKWTK